MNDNQGPRQVQPDETPITEAPATEGPVLYAGFDAEMPTGTTAGMTNVSAPLGHTSTLLSTPSQVQQVITTKSHKKGLVIGTILAVASLGLVGGSAGAYMIYQEPENVLLHTASNMLSLQKVRTKTTVTSDVVYGTGDQKISLEQLTFESGIERLPRADTNAELKVLYGDKHIVLKADVLFTEAGELYFRVSNAKDTIKKTLDESMTMSAEAESIIDKIDGKWATYTIADLTKDSPEYGKVAQCTLDIYKKHKDDSSVTQELVDSYKANQFIVIDGEPQDRVSEVGYVVKIDNKKLAAYSKATESTTVAKELRTCDGSKAPISDASDDSEEGMNAPEYDDTVSGGPITVTTLWITKFSHKLRAIDVKITWPKGVDGKPFTMTTRTDIIDDQGVTTAAPSGAMTAKQWFEYTQTFSEELTGSSVSSRAEDSAIKTQAATIAKKAELYNAITGEYPMTVADFAKNPESSLQDASMVVATLPADTGHIAYKKCKDIGAQVVYKQSDGTFIANNLGRPGGNNTAVTALCL